MSYYGSPNNYGQGNPSQQRGFQQQPPNGQQQYPSQFPNQPQQPQYNQAYPSTFSSDDQWYSTDNPESPKTDSNPYNGNMNTGYSSSVYGGGINNMSMGVGGEEDYDNEPPILEELGIRFDHIWSKTQAVIHPLKTLEDHILDDADLAGPLVFCLIMGSLLLLSGKVHFGYIYGFSVFGCLCMNGVLNLISERGIDFWITCSVLGYSLLPVVCMSGLAVFLPLQNLLGLILSAVAICWATHAATRLFVVKMALEEGYFLIAYPSMLLYSSFVLITIF